MDQDQVGSVTQAAAIVTCSIFFYMVYLIALGPVIDSFMYNLAGAIDLTPWGEQQMLSIMVFGAWWYHFIKLIVIMLIIWLFIFIIRRWRYNRQVDEYDWFEKV